MEGCPCHSAPGTEGESVASTYGAKRPRKLGLKEFDFGAWLYIITAKS